MEIASARRVAAAALVLLGFAFSAPAHSQSCSYAQPESPTTSATSGPFRIYVHNVTYASSVYFPTWGDPGGQDDLVWYQGSIAGPGLWYADIDLGNHKAGNPEYGNFTTHVYINGNVFCTATNFTRVHPTPGCSSVASQASMTTATSGPFRVFAYGVHDASAVRFPTWGEPGDQDDLVWYEGIDAGGGTWYADVDLGNHKYGNPEYGTFTTHVYMSSPDGDTFCGGMNWSRVLPTPACSSVAMSSTYTTELSGLLRVYAYGVHDTTSMSFPTWGETNGQDDLVWYPGADGGGGTWYADINLGNHKFQNPEFGNFTTDVYANGPNGQSYCGRLYWTRDNALSPVISAQCSQNNPIKYLSTPDAHTSGATIEANIAALGISRPANGPNPNLQPIFDIRYTNDMIDYPNSGNDQFANHLSYTGINSSTAGPDYSNEWAVGTAASRYDPSAGLAQKKCINGSLTFGAMVNGWDIPNQTVNGGGPQATLTYKFVGPLGSGTVSPVQPWTANGGSLMLQGYFVPAFHTGTQGGGQLNFNLMLQHASNPNELLNYVINVYDSHGPDNNEDPSQNDEANGGIPFVGTAIVDHRPDGSPMLYTTKSPYSSSSAGTRDYAVTSESWPQFFRVNISRQNLQNYLTFLQKNSTPDEWRLREAGVQWEIGGAYESLGGSFTGFEVYQTGGPM